MKRSIYIILALMLFSSTFTVKADEGMWMVNMMEKGLIQKMKKAGLKLPANVIYDESALSIKDAIVSLDFGCTGSMISQQGLLITNHHCAYSDVHSISTDEYNYLEDGFWAFSMKDEVHIPGKGAWFLKKVLDVTDEVNELISKNEKMGMRKLAHTLEKKYSDESGYEASLATMWRGEKYYMYLYEVYRDLRLVAAPPVSIAAFGGDTDNWEWPQHKGDFAMYRIYTAPDGSPAEYSEENVPMVPKKVLNISTKGVKKGDFTMILGYPGSTNRYNSSFGVHKIGKVVNPITTEVRGDQLAIMDKWMKTDPSIRLKYADKYFGISNVQELGAGEILTFRRYNVYDIKKAEEEGLQEWINSNPERVEKWGDLLEDMEQMYSKLEEIDKNIAYFRETMVRGTQFYFLSMRFKPTPRQKESDTINISENDFQMRNITKALAQMDYDVEKDLFYYNFKTFIQNVDKAYWGEEITSLMEEFNSDANALLEYVWKNSFITDETRFKKFITEPHLISEITSDPLYRIVHSTSIGRLNDLRADKMNTHGRGKGKKGGRARVLSALEKEYTHALYQMRQDKGIVQYPDANSTMRITYGNVGPISPSDGIFYSETTTAQGILDKYNPDDYEFTLKEKQLNLVKANPKFPVNFLSNNDITGGNSGSPVLNAKGELIGLAFDGNKESLCSDAYFHPEYCKCVNVDIRYVLFILEQYAEADNLMKELGF